MKDVILRLKNREEQFYKNDIISYSDYKKGLSFSGKDIEDARLLLKRFRPLIKEALSAFSDGKVESEFLKSEVLAKETGSEIYFKADFMIEPVRSVKARGALYEIIKHIDDILKDRRIYEEKEKINAAYIREILRDYTVEVSSTGNLGIAVGLIARAFNFKVEVHMSKEAKRWKKDKLREAGVTVREYDGDYGKAVEEGRKHSSLSEKSYFVDDERSAELFLGYAQAAFETARYFPDDKNLRVFLPCGVGGAPTGIAFGLREIYGDDIEIYFVEPVNYPSMLLSTVNDDPDISIRDIGINEDTLADGLACPKSSPLLRDMAANIVNGFFTVSEENIKKYKKEMLEKENLNVEYSSALSLGPMRMIASSDKKNIMWLTGGNVS